MRYEPHQCQKCWEKFGSEEALHTHMINGLHQYNSNYRYYKTIKGVKGVNTYKELRMQVAERDTGIWVVKRARFMAKD